MTRTILFSASLASAIGLFALGVEAQTQGTAPQAQQRMSIAQIATKLESQGYRVREIEFERGRYEVEMFDANGMKLEAHVDPATGAFLPYRDDDDRSDRDDRYDD